MKNKIPLWLAGGVEGSYKKKLEDYAKKFDVELKFLGYIRLGNGLEEHYSSASLFAFPTPMEDFGLVPAESLICGTPCVIWGDDGGPTEQVIHGVNGFHAKPYDKKDFATKMDSIIEENLKEKNKNQIVESARKFTGEVQKKIYIGAIKTL